MCLTGSFWSVRYSFSKRLHEQNKDKIERGGGGGRGMLKSDRMQAIQEEDGDLIIEVRVAWNLVDIALMLVEVEMGRGEKYYFSLPVPFYNAQWNWNGWASRFGSWMLLRPIWGEEKETRHILALWWNILWDIRSSEA
jgi:hypothetical protein